MSTEPDRSKSENSELPADTPVGPSGDGHGPAEISSDAEARPEDPPRSDLPDEEPPDDEKEVAENEVDDDDQYQGEVAPLEEIIEEEQVEDVSFDWYILKVQVNRENSICDALRRRVAREGMDEYFREIVVPTEDVVEFTKSGKKRTVKKKLYPGYIMVNMALTEETWFLVRETSGIGDFTGSAGKPTPMDPEEVRRIIKVKRDEDEESDEEEVRIAIPFNVGDRVRVKEGYFQNFEGDVEAIDSANGRVTVMINIFGRSTPVELQHWQMERV